MDQSKFEAANKAKGEYTESTIKLTADGSQIEFEVIVTKPKIDRPMPVYIYAHGGGGVLGSA
jgi:acetyl esterase/lipase